MGRFLAVPLAVVLAGFPGFAGSGRHFARLAGHQAKRFGYAAGTSPIRARCPRRRKLMNVKILQVAVLLLPMSRRGDSLSAGIGTGSGPGGLPFRRIVDIPFETCVAALEGWRQDGHHTELQLGQSTLRGPAEHDRGSGTCRVEVRRPGDRCARRGA